MSQEEHLQSIVSSQITLQVERYTLSTVALRDNQQMSTEAFSTIISHEDEKMQVSNYHSSSISLFCKLICNRKL